MITVKKIDIKEHADLDSMNEYSIDYDYNQHGHRYELYLIKDLAYWDAIVVVDAVDKKIVAMKSQVIGLAEAQKILERSD